MTDKGNNRIYRFSCDPDSQREKLSPWREALGQSKLGLDFEPLGQDPCWCEASLSILPNLGFGRLSAGQARIARTSTLLSKNPSDDLVLCLDVRGKVCASTRGRSVELSGASAMLLPYIEPGSVVFPGKGASYLGIQIPRDVIEPRVKGATDMVLRPFAAKQQVLQLLLSYLRILQVRPLSSSPSAQHAAAGHVHELIALALQRERESIIDTDTGGMRAARLVSIKSFLRENLHSEDLSPTSVADHLGITARYVHKLFEAEETSFSRYVLKLRLEYAHYLLTHPRHAKQTITDIAHAAGFRDLSYFNRCFRRRYDEPPSSVRANARCRPTKSDT